MAGCVPSVYRGTSPRHGLSRLSRRRRDFRLLSRRRQRFVVFAGERLRAIVGGGSAGDEGSDRGRPLNPVQTTAFSPVATVNASPHLSSRKICCGSRRVLVHLLIAANLFLTANGYS